MMCSIFRVTKQNRSKAGAVIALLITGTLILTACSDNTAPNTNETQQSASSAAQIDKILSEHNLGGKTTKDVIDTLDTQLKSDRPADLIASIRPTGLFLKDSSLGEATMPMPTDEFYLSFAPYINQTHECYFHSLTTCTGELQNKAVEVTVTSKETGETIVNENINTNDNGFAGLWLPRGIDATITVSADGKTATTDISTKSDEDATCLTTLKLA